MANSAEENLEIRPSAVTRAGRVLVYVLAIIGAISLAIFGLNRFVQFESFEQITRKEFGTPNAIRALVALYARAESAAGKSELRIVSQNPHSGMTTRRIPKPWLPKQFASWGHPADEPEVDFGDVLAYYDVHDVLVAIEFCRSRYGCYISRRKDQLPSDFVKLIRLSTEPIYVTGIISDET